MRIVADEVTLELVEDDEIRPARLLTASLRLVVIRSQDIERSAEFYRTIGLDLVKHRHGTGPEHFAAEQYGWVFEVYPETVKSGSTRGARVGFNVSDLDLVIDKLQRSGSAIVTQPTESEWGRRAVVIDPDGHRVELYG
jgi:hypothetical protein